TLDSLKRDLGTQYCYSCFNFLPALLVLLALPALPVLMLPIFL
ncbi:MAG: hypothetical protein RL373_1285, partial [Pseudomonadota bacterium]